MATRLRLALRLGGLELVALTGLGAALAAGALVVAARLDGLGIPAACFVPASDPSSAQAGGLDCRGTIAFWDTASASTAALRPLAAVFPFLVGLFLGVPLVGRELEAGTARLAWSLAPSRARWLVLRLVAATLIAGALLVPVALSMDRLEAATNPVVDPWHSFSDMPQRGLSAVGWGVAALGAGTLAGAVVGRQLPAMVVAAALCAGGWVAVDGAMNRWLDAEAIPLTGSLEPSGARFVDLRYRDADTGAILSAAEVDRLIPPERQADGDWLAAHFPAVLYGVPGSRYREVDATLGGLGLALATAAASAAMVVVPRRRP